MNDSPSASPPTHDPVVLRALADIAETIRDPKLAPRRRLAQVARILNAAGVTPEEE